MSENSIGPRALIVEGGAMRGIFSTGLLDTFQEHDFSPFDSFWGVSAGASNLAAYLAKMPGRNFKVYSDYANRKEFMQYGRFLKGGHLIDLDWLWEITMAELGIDKQVFDADPRPLFLVVTNQQTGQAEYIQPSSDELVETMKASSALPILYRSGVSLGGKYYVDGGIADSIPVAEAISRGAKQIMVIRSQKHSYKKKPNKQSGLTRFAFRKTPGLIQPTLNRPSNYNQSLDLMRNPPEGIEIVEICPPESFKLARLSRDSKSLCESYEMGKKMGLEAMEKWSAISQDKIVQA